MRDDTRYMPKKNCERAQCEQSAVSDFVFHVANIRSFSSFFQEKLIILQFALWNANWQKVNHLILCFLWISCSREVLRSG